MPYERDEDLPKQAQGLPEHAKHIYREAHNSALDEYKDPDKRRGDASLEETAHKVAWAAVKNEYEKKGDEWVKKEPYDSKREETEDRTGRNIPE